ncbi:unnamed protein product [Onchocerca ochengi]|uniref:ZP domain-containing protein n=1 Tax=Onchocerca ochengi TaxID=42157 RepID=A0A182EKH3_ONCOC|nr:unnamed protein product [Onchocerca ochengi]
MDGLRLFFESEMPFYGHIYVKESFMNKRCHLDFTQKPLTNAKEPPGFNYYIIVVVQYHHLFLTKDDRIYRVKCFYRKGSDNLNLDMEVGNVLTTKELSSENVMKCVYEVRDSTGKPVKYANVGDKLIHTWNCASEKYGMLIHSCFVRKSDDNVFQLVDDRGCITDSTLMDPLEYSEDLTKAFSVVPAFKFVDEPMIHFQCKVTVCIKEENGCKGISPPDCKIEPSRTVPTQQTPTTTKSAKSTSSSMVSPESDQLCEITQREVGQNETRNYKRKRSVKKSELTMDSLSRKFLIMMNSTTVNHFTLDVNADQLMILERNEMNRRRSPEILNIACKELRNGMLLQNIVFILLLAFFLIIIFMQKRYYNKHLLKCDFVPSSENMFSNGKFEEIP